MSVMTLAILTLGPYLGVIKSPFLPNCPKPASIAIGGAVKAKKEHVSVSIALVTIWAIIMIFFIPLVSRLLNLHPAPVGAWVGSSEFADAAGYAAAEAYGSMVGDKEPAIRTFTLMKVIGRDIWLGMDSHLHSYAFDHSRGFPRSAGGGSCLRAEVI